MFVITFCPRSNHLLVSWLQSPSAQILEPKKSTASTFSPFTCHEVMGLDAMILVFIIFGFKCEASGPVWLIAPAAMHGQSQWQCRTWESHGLTNVLWWRICRAIMLCGMLLCWKAVVVCVSPPWCGSAGLRQWVCVLQKCEQRPEAKGTSAYKWHWTRNESLIQILVVSSHYLSQPQFPYLYRGNSNFCSL